MQYRSKEVVEAIQYTGSNEEEVAKFVRSLPNNKRLPIVFDNYLGFRRMTITYKDQERIVLLTKNWYVLARDSIVDTFSTNWFESHYTVSIPFSKEAYELVDDFVCTMMNRVPAISQEVIDELIPEIEHDKGDGEAIILHKKIVKLVEALETIKKALEEK